jgi:hypothetical protein
MRIILVAVLLFTASAALASPQCTNEPSDRWIPIEEMKKKVVSLGHRIDVFKTTKGNCYSMVRTAQESGLESISTR